MNDQRQNSGKRVCVVRQSVYPYELSVRREVETLYRSGHETHVISLDTQEDGHKREERIEGVYVHRLPLIRKKTSVARYVFDYLSFFLLAMIKLTQLHLKHRFDVIQVNTMPDFLVFCTIVPKMMGAKVLLMMHEPVPELWLTKYNSPPPRLLTLTEQSALAYADRVLTVTQQLKDVYVTRGADAEKISVILNVPESRFLTVEEDTALDEDTAAVTPDEKYFTLICHGAIEKRYGHDTMLDAVKLVKSQIPTLRLRILGKGSYLDEFLEQTRQMKLDDSVQYLGWVPLSELVRELQAADVGIVAQKSSPYSNLVHTNKMYDYLNFGLPVLASRLKAVEAYWDDDSLYFFEPGSPESLAEGILDLYQHPNKQKLLVEYSQQLYNQYKWDEQKKIYLSTYETLMA
jgi:glycosyltransferase involved in cell wall biosynthesis